MFLFLYLLPIPAKAATGINKQINFQGKVVNKTAGTNVTNGNYDFVFRIYDAASGGSVIWTETRTAANQVAVTDGIFRVSLGSVQALPGSVDFNTDNLYLDITFNGETMTTRVQFAAVPYAFNALKVAGLTVTDTTGTFTLTAGKTLSVANTLSFAGTDGTTITFQGTDTYVGLATTDVLTNKTIGSTGLTFSGATTDITTATNEDLTVLGAGTGDVVISNDSNSNFRVVGTAASGVDMVDITNSGQGTTTDGVDGLAIDFTSTADSAADTNAGLHVTITDSGDSGDTISGLQVTAGGAAAGTQYGINIEGITAGGGTEYALVVGTGWDRGLSVGSASTFTAALTSEATTVIGASGNTFTFNPASGPLYAGTARPTKRITLSPEYAGATFTADGAANTGTMVSDNMTSSPYRNFYKWSNSEVTVQDYDVWIRVPLPSDFAAMAATPTLSLDTYTSNTSTGVVAVTVYDTSGTADCTSASFTPSLSTTWETKTQTTCLDTGTYAANGVMTIAIKVTAPASGGETRIGDLYFDYLAKF
ncbi:MAG: hypothetical protein UZ21_OP11001000936 [Microgenomates bacterium OLB22]|nr:MAG: hypothetical protein UZ21_OP11001000936 [Microgenomates bacterium OLB22]